MSNNPSKVIQLFTFLLFFFIFVLNCWSIDTGSAASGISLYNQGKLKEAREVLERAVDTGEAGIPERTILGMIYTRLKEYDRARKILTFAQQQDPSNPEVLYALGMLELAIGEYEASAKWLKMADNNSNSLQQTKKLWTDSMVKRSVELYKEGKYDACEKTLEEVLQIDAYNPVVIAMLIQLRKERGRTEGLVDLYRHFVVAEPENAQAYAELGELLLYQGKFSAAEEAFLNAEAFGTDEPYPYYYLARSDLNHETPGSDHITRLHLAIGKAVRKISMIKMQAAGTIKNQQGEVGAEELKKIEQLLKLSDKPHQIVIESIRMLKDCYPDCKDYEQDIRRLIDWYPRSLDLCIELGNLLEEQHRFSEAYEYWQSVLEDFSTAVEAHMGLGRSLKALGKTHQSIIAYRRARDLDPENPEIYSALEKLYRADGRDKDLLQLYSELYQRERTNTALIYARANLEERMGLLEEATLHRLRADELEGHN